MSRINEFGQPIGREVAWTPAKPPQPREFIGNHVRLEPLTVQHTPELLAAIGQPASIWTYLPFDAPSELNEMSAIVEHVSAPADWLPFLIRNLSGEALGTLSYLRIQPALASIEVGAVIFGPALQRTPGSTEAQYLLMRHAFEDLGYRRYEWKCDSLNAASRSAATRLGFTEEGTWRNALIYKGRNRDTTWLSITDDEWPALKAAFEAWLADSNFDASGGQRSSLSSLR